MRQLLLRFLIGLTPVMLLATPLFAQAAGKSPMSGLGGMLPMLLVMFVVIFFFMIRPEQKKAKERQRLLAAIKRGDRVMTSAGIFATVDNVKDTTVVLKISDNTKVEFSKSAVTAILNSDGSEKTPDKEEKAS
jgi:preprotein translocase subunit YajC